ncbi:hypothetical protein N431DRAFT_468352 [Stipitochalara longipes BDJ]|nr:hypothetical protein N431DRAFT_468352 [Stipitochalara longipes BDJ]
MSKYAEAKSIQSSSTYYTALGSRNLLISPRRKSNENVLVPSSQTIKAVKRLQQEGNFDPRSTDSKHPSSASLMPRLEYALAVNKVGDACTAESINALNSRATAPDQIVREAHLPLNESHSAKEHRQPQPLLNRRAEQMLPPVRGIGGEPKYISFPLASRLSADDISSSDSEPIDAEDIRKLAAKCKREQPDLLILRLQEVEDLCFENEQRPTQQHWSIENLVTNPTKIIPEEDFWDADIADIPENEDHWLRYQDTFKVDEKAVFEISPDAPRSAELAALFKNQYEPPQTNTRRRILVPRSLCVSRTVPFGTGESKWRSCTYEELTWIEMMDRWTDFDEWCSYQEVECRFWKRFGWKLPQNWVFMTRNIYQNPICYKKSYMGWYPEVVAWKRRVVSVQILKKKTQG